jgi:hypothetical protein
VRSTEDKAPCYEVFSTPSSHLDPRTYGYYCLLGKRDFSLAQGFQTCIVVFPVFYSVDIEGFSPKGKVTRVVKLTTCHNIFPRLMMDGAVPTLFLSTSS